MELRMNPTTPPAPLTFNYEEVKAGVTETAAIYENMVYGDDQISTAKADRAKLNKFIKALNDERIKQEREFMQPFSDFKAKVNEIIGIANKAVSAIDKQVKSADERRKAEKQKAIEEFFEGCKFQIGVRLEQIFDPKWLNASYSMETVKEDITLRMEQAVRDIESIHALPEYAFEAEVVYLSTLDLRRALDEAKRLRDMAARKAERLAAIEAAEAQMKAQQAQIEQAAATVAKKETVKKVAKLMKENADFNATPANYAMAAYKLNNTLTENGSVKRGVCLTDDDNKQKRNLVQRFLF